MKNLILIRHAKSSWHLPLHDHDRPLLPEGIEKAIRLAKATADEIPDKALVWSSTAKRASETAGLFMEQWSRDKSQVQLEVSLYTFDAHQLEKVIRTCPETEQNLIVFGHNNAITDFVNKFGDIFIDQVPTAGLVWLIFESDNWSAIRPGKTKKVLFPRDC